MSDIIFITEWQLTLMLLICMAGGVMMGLALASRVKQPVLEFQSVDKG